MGVIAIFNFNLIIDKIIEIVKNFAELKEKKRNLREIRRNEKRTTLNQLFSQNRLLNN